MQGTGNKIPWMTEFAYLDESLDINQTQSYHLSIQLGLNGLSFCILDTVTRKYIALRHYPLTEEDDANTGKIKEIVEKDEILQKPFKSTAALIESFKSTLVPSALFRKSEIKRFFEFAHEHKEDEVLLTDQVHGPDAWCIYSVPSYYPEFLSEVFPEIRIFHHSTPFLEAIHSNAPGKKKEAGIHLLIHDQFFDLAVTRNQKLELCNTYAYRQVNDIVYFVLNVIRMLQLDQNKVPVNIQGKINPQSSLLMTLKRYVRHISLDKRNPAYTYSYKFNDVEAHTYANLFNLHSCV